MAELGWAAQRIVYSSEKNRKKEREKIRKRLVKLVFKTKKKYSVLETHFKSNRQNLIQLNNLLNGWKWKEIRAYLTGLKAQAQIEIIVYLAHIHAEFYSLRIVSIRFFKTTIQLTIGVDRPSIETSGNICGWPNILGRAELNFIWTESRSSNWMLQPNQLVAQTDGEWK